MGQRNGFSPGDIAKLKAMYHCNSANAPSKPAAASSGASAPSAHRPARPVRPNRPVLNVLGNIIRPFRPRGDEVEYEGDVNDVTLIEDGSDELESNNI